MFPFDFEYFLLYDAKQVLNLPKLPQHFLPLDGGGKVGVRKVTIISHHYNPLPPYQVRGRL
jgi:hypothetical protein